MTARRPDTERGTYCSGCGRRVAVTADGVARKHNRGPRNRGQDYACVGSHRPTVERPAVDAARALQTRPANDMERTQSR